MGDAGFESQGGSKPIKSNNMNKERISLLHGLEFLYTCQDYVFSGKISVDNDFTERYENEPELRVYMCHNNDLFAGGNTEDKLGFEYSWLLMINDQCDTLVHRVAVILPNCSPVPLLHYLRAESLFDIIHD